MSRSVITGTGTYIPDRVQLNEDFAQNIFFDDKGLPLTSTPEAIIEKFRKITGIRERRYVPTNINASDIAAEAGKQAILDSGIDPETLDQIVVSHNFGDVAYGSRQSQNVPSLASRVKHILGISQPECIAYDVLVGCPGWIHSIIQSHAVFKAGMAKKILLIGTETLSRVIDLSDRDSMIFADGAGACVLEDKDIRPDGPGILGTSAQTHAMEEFDYINMGKSCNSYEDNAALYIKMKGRKVYEYALTYVPSAMKSCLDRAEVDIRQVSKILIHQANV
jgi:3-oxoacyl-[acyl-carrier-protein] synthase-3